MPFWKTENPDHTAALEATQAYVKGMTKLPDVSCKVERVEAGFARVSASSASGKVSPIHGFARKGKDGKWQVLAMGSFFDQEFFKKNGIPASLQQA